MSLGAETRFEANWAFFRDFNVIITFAIVSKRLDLVYIFLFDLFLRLMVFGDNLNFCVSFEDVIPSESRGF